MTRWTKDQICPREIFGAKSAFDNFERPYFYLMKAISTSLRTFISRQISSRVSSQGDYRLLSVLSLETTFSSANRGIFSPVKASRATCDLKVAEIPQPSQGLNPNCSMLFHHDLCCYRCCLPFAIHVCSRSTISPFLQCSKY